MTQCHVELLHTHTLFTHIRLLINVKVNKWPSSIYIYNFTSISVNWIGFCDRCMSLKWIIQYGNIVAFDQMNNFCSDCFRRGVHNFDLGQFWLRSHFHYILYISIYLYHYYKRIEYGMDLPTTKQRENAREAILDKIVHSISSFLVRMNVKTMMLLRCRLVYFTVFFFYWDLPCTQHQHIEHTHKHIYV